MLGCLPSLESGQAGARWQKEGTARTQVSTMYWLEGQALVLTAGGLGQCQAQLRSPLLHGSTSRQVGGPGMFLVLVSQKRQSRLQGALVADAASCPEYTVWI